uniref:Uncharacterized protein n=1 Tax=Helianthus annuus TaxID=4232 RepID=A0A251VE19_HELAN
MCGVAGVGIGELTQKWKVQDHSCRQLQQLQINSKKVGSHHPSLICLKMIKGLIAGGALI